MPKAKLDNAYEILLDYGYIEPGVSDREYWEALKQATLDFKEENNIEYFDIVRAEEKELRDKVVPKVKKKKITGAAFKKGTSQESVENIQANNEVTSLAIREPRPDVTAKDITPEVTEEVEPKKAEVKTSPVGEGLKNILNSIAGTTESIKNVLMGQQKADSDAAKDAAKDAEKSARAGQEKKLESKVFEGVKKVGEKVLKPVQGIFEKIWGFLKKVLLADIVRRLFNWLSDDGNKKKIGSIFKFVKNFWPLLLTGFLLFGTGIGSLITGTVSAIAGFIPTLLGLIPGLVAFLASPIGLAVLGTAAVVGGGVWLHNKMKGDDNGNDNKTEGNKTEKVKSITPTENGEASQKFSNFNKGGLVQNFNTGGSVPGKGNTDTVPAMLTPGEFVLTKEATEKYGTDTLESMNAAAATGKDETSGTGRLIGSTIGGLAGGVVGFFADTPVSPAADIALGIAGSAAGGEIGDNIERKITGKGNNNTNNNTNNKTINNNVTNATQSFRNGGLVQYLNNGGQASGADILGSHSIQRTKDGGVYAKSTIGGVSGGGLDQTTTSTYKRTFTEADGTVITLEEKKKMKDQIASIGVPDLIEHQDQLLSEIHKLKGFESVTIGQVINQKTGIPQEKLLPILLRSDAQKATSDKEDKAMKEDMKARGIKPGQGWNISANDEVGRSLAGTTGYRRGQTYPDQLIMSSTEFDSLSKSSKTTGSNSFSGLSSSINVSAKDDGTRNTGQTLFSKTKGFNKGGLVQHFNKGGLVQYLNNGGRVLSTKQNATLQKGKVTSGNMNQSDAEKLKREIELEKAEDRAISIYGFNSPEYNEVQKQKLILSGTPPEAIYTDKNGEVKVKGYSTFDGKTIISGKKRGKSGFGRLIGGAADMMTGGLFDFDNRSGGGLLRKTANAVGRVAGGTLDMMTGNLTDFDGKGGKTFGSSRVLAGAADALTGNRFDFDKHGKPAKVAKSKPKHTEIAPPSTSSSGRGSKPGVTAINAGGVGPTIDATNDMPLPEVPPFSATLYRSPDKIKTLGIMV